MLSAAKRRAVSSALDKLPSTPEPMARSGMGAKARSPFGERRATRNQGIRRPA
jgi:hypothetical protein